MNHSDVIQLTQQSLWLVLMLSAPPIVVAAVIGLLIAFVQAATQLQEQTIQYVAKFFAIVLTIFVTASMLGGGLYNFGDRVFTEFAGMVTKH
jgi:type III secretion protein S